MARCLILLALIVPLLFTSSCPAEDGATSSLTPPGSAVYDDTAQLEGIVVTSTKLPMTKGNVTQEVDIITGKQIEDMVLGRNNLAEALTYQPGIFVSPLSRNDANWGSYGGLGPKYNVYLLDGLPIDSFVDTMSLSPWSLDRIETQRGPASVLYPNYLSMDFAGNQSSLAGTTNLITRERVDGMMTKVWQDYGFYNTALTQVHHQNVYGNLHYYIGGQYERSDYTNYGTPDSWLHILDDPQYQKAKVYFRSTYFAEDSHNQKVSVFFNNTWHDGDVGRPNRGFDHDYALLNANYYNEITSCLTSQVKVGYRRYDRTWQEDNFPDLTLRERDGVLQNIVPADVSFAYKHLDGGLLTVGSDFQYASYQTFSEVVRRLTQNDATAYQTGIYAQEEMVLGKWVLRAGGRWSYTEHNYDLFGGSIPAITNKSWDQGLWSAGVRYNFTPDLSVYANGGSSYLVPAIKSIAGTLSPQDRGVPGKNGQLPNPDLMPETGIGADLGVAYQPIRNVKLGVRGFYNHLEDAIVTKRVFDDPSQSQDINAGKAKSFGVEVDFRHRVLPYLEWFANYTHTVSEISNPLDPDQDGVEIPFVPANMGNIGVSADFPHNFTATLYLHVAGTIFDSNSRKDRKSFEPYETLNAKLIKVIAKTECYEANVHLDLYNITNKRFDMPWQFEDPGFAAAGGVGIQF